MIIYPNNTFFLKSFFPYTFFISLFLFFSFLRQVDRNDARRRNTRPIPIREFPVQILSPERASSKRGNPETRDLAGWPTTRWVPRQLFVVYLFGVENPPERRSAEVEIKSFLLWELFSLSFEWDSGKFRSAGGFPVARCCSRAATMHRAAELLCLCRALSVSRQEFSPRGSFSTDTRCSIHATRFTSRLLPVTSSTSSLLITDDTRSEKQKCQQSENPTWKWDIFEI